MDDRSGRSPLDQPPRPIPRDDHQLQSCGGRGARHRDGGDPARHAAAAIAPRPDDDLPGQRAGVPGFADDGAALDPRGAGLRLPDPRRALRELHSPADHPVDAAVGGPWRARHPHAVRLRIQPRRPHRHHPAHRHREEERHHDGRFRHLRRARGRPDARPRRSARRRSCASVRS